MFRIFVFTGLAVLSLALGVAHAADAGAKARGDYNFYNGGPTAKAYARAMHTALATATVPTVRRAFSVEATGAVAAPTSERSQSAEPTYSPAIRTYRPRDQARKPAYLRLKTDPAKYGS